MRVESRRREATTPRLPSARVCQSSDAEPYWFGGALPQAPRRRREIDSFFISEVDRDKLVLAGSPLETFETL